MLNQVQQGEAISVVSGAGFTAGTPYLVGSLFGVAATTVLTGATGVLWTKGVYAITKHSTEVWAVGDALYWDDSNHYLTNVIGAGPRVGVATAVTANPSSTGNCRLDGVATAGNVVGAAANYKLARGSAAALDGSNPTPITTGLATITAATVTLRGTAAPGDNTSVLTLDYTGSDGTLNVYAWKNTGGTDPTLVASTGTETFDWVAIGT